MKRRIVKEAPEVIILLIKIVARFIWKERKHDMLYNRLHQSRTIHVQRREREKTSTRSCVQLVEGNSVPKSNYFQFSPNTSLKLRSFTHERKFALRQAFTIFVSVAVLIQEVRPCARPLIKYLWCNHRSLIIFLLIQTSLLWYNSFRFWHQTWYMYVGWI